jgi:hypothetical protein
VTLGPVPWNGRFVAGTVADVLLAIAKERPAAPNTGKTALLGLKARLFRLDACFVRIMVMLSMLEHELPPK